MTFEGKVVLVTGANGNLGRAVAKAFAVAGARLILVDRHGSGIGQGSERQHVLEADLLDAQQIGQVAAQAIARWGQVNVVCNLAGGFAMGSCVHEAEADEWERMFDMNVRTVLNMSRALVPHLISTGSGKVINVGAYSSAKGLARMGPYVASKDALARLTESMSAELRDYRINVNAVLPGILDTPENRAAMPDADATRWVEPTALADVILFLASDAACAIHGALIPVVNRT